MGRQYLRPIPVVLRDWMPAAFRWRGADYTVAEVLSTWHLRDQWWASPEESDARRAESDRYYYHVRCPDEQVFDLYHALATGLLVLDRVQDYKPSHKLGAGDSSPRIHHG